MGYYESMLANNRSTLCIVMTYCDGGDLEGYLKKNRGVMKESKAMLKTGSSIQ